MTDPRNVAHDKNVLQEKSIMEKKLFPALNTHRNQARSHI